MKRRLHTDTGSSAEYTRRVFFSGREIVETVRAGATQVPRLNPSDPAARWITDDGLPFGVIASDTEPFCGECNRMRLTAQGRLRGCLYEAGGTDLRAALRDEPEAARARVESAFGAKTSHHPACATSAPRALQHGGDRRLTAASSSRQPRGPTSPRS